ncbi:hypothetical protein CGZ93_15680 [Enemella dayhoffiae]|uniref:Uncharacterized protein n=1 Tax=Enemella dayhoffiae TaxID=2016507 RepID=A0A255GRJ6_9ACTN|nr:DUF1800 family protein [Enemella dayhoffiae]OYO18419.1 hypothetical protein CGZ93_15680 [Enemella dayhoffiae]
MAPRPSRIPRPTATLTAQIAGRTPRQWLEEQLNPAGVADPRVEAIIAKYYPVVNAETGAEVRTYTADRPWEAAPALVRAIVLRQVFGNRHLLESMTEFWPDQIFVGAQGKSESYVAHFNHTVLRRHALGRFADLLLAALRHPALLAYLDNDANSRDNPNENLGREVPELHTVGVPGWSSTATPLGVARAR